MIGFEVKQQLSKPSLRMHHIIYICASPQARVGVEGLSLHFLSGCDF